MLLDQCLFEDGQCDATGCDGDRTRHQCEAAGRLSLRSPHLPTVECPAPLSAETFCAELCRARIQSQLKYFEHQCKDFCLQQALVKALHNCKEVLAELLPEVVLSSALTGFESMSKFDVIGAEGQSLFAHKARALRELAHVSPQLMKGTASEALGGLLRQ